MSATDRVATKEFLRRTQRLPEPRMGTAVMALDASMSSELDSFKNRLSKAKYTNVAGYS